MSGVRVRDPLYELDRQPSTTDIDGLSRALISMTGLSQMASVASGSLEDAYKVRQTDRHIYRHTDRQTDISLDA